ncbi:MAG: hypothetical protein ABIN89_04240 [Chitinophagaceae bacterium]
MKKVIFLIAVAAYFVVYGYTTLTVYECLSVALFVFFILRFVDDLGKKLVILDVAIIIALITCLLLPIAGYHFFTSTNMQSKVWVNFMRVPSADYYSFMFPATLAMMLGMKLPVFYQKITFRNQVQYMINVKTYLAQTKWQGLILVVIGLVASVAKNYVPSSLAFVSFLLSYLMFVGIFYCLYSNMPFKRSILIAVFGVLIVRSILGGMFGEMIFMGALTIILLVLGYRISFTKKFLILVAGIFGIIILQAIKPGLRKQTWSGKNKGNEIAIFSDLIKEKISDPASILDDKRMLFLMYARFNQGQIISNVLYSVPARFPYANGETIATSLAASIVPRVIWADKPEAGGAYNFQRFLGIKLKGWSANVSPFGEAWGNFGRIGGIIFMFFFGLLFNFFLFYLLKVAVNYPSIILWFPYLFFYAVSIENDVLTMVNSFSKAAIFTYFFYRVFPKIFGLKI